MSSAALPMKVEFQLDEQKKNAVRYKELDGGTGEKMGTVYLKKHLFPDGVYPEQILVTIESV